MLKAMMAGLLSMTALVPPALAQDGRSMDRGAWRRERAERPPPSPQQAAPAERPVPAPRDGDGAARPSSQPGGWQGRRDDRVGSQPGDREGRGDNRADRQRGDWQDRRDDRPGRQAGDWQGRRDARPDRQAGGWQERRDARPDRQAGDWQGRRDDPRGTGRDGDRRWDRGVPRPPVAGGGWDRGPDRRDDGRNGGDRVWRSERAEPRQRFGGYDRPAPPSATWRSGRSAGWDRDWRRDPRYDWNRYRNERRSAFRLPRYYAPYGWNAGYRRFGVGVPLSPMLYTPRYWIYDPYAYRLPDAGEPYRWVRYYDDALLVDIEDGTVVDVIHGIFA